MALLAYILLNLSVKFFQYKKTRPEDPVLVSAGNIRRTHLALSRDIFGCVKKQFSQVNMKT